MAPIYPVKSQSLLPERRHTVILVWVFLSLLFLYLESRTGQAYTNREDWVNESVFENSN